MPSKLQQMWQSNLWYLYVCVCVCVCVCVYTCKSYSFITPHAVCLHNKEKGLFLLQTFKPTCCIRCKGSCCRSLMPVISWTSPLTDVRPSFSDARSSSLCPLNTKPAMTPENGLSTRCLAWFHFPPIWIRAWLLNTDSRWSGMCRINNTCHPWSVRKRCDNLI